MQERSERGGAGSGRLLALALLLPPFVLAWPGPGTILWNDFLPSATGAGAMALATLPAALLLLRRGSVLPRGLALLAVLLLAAAGWLAFGHATDTFEQRRTIVHAAAAFVLFLGGGRLTDEGRAVYARGIVLLALLLCGVAILDPDDAFAGVLGNTGSIAMAALPGALAGACLATRKAGGWRIASGLAVLAFLAYVARVPVIAGGLAFATGAMAFVAGSAGSSSRFRTLVAGLAVLAVVGVFAPLQRHAPLPTSSPPAYPQTSTSPDSGGIEVRYRIWQRSLAMLADHPWSGVGPGQFAARFPPYRDPKEIELSTHGRRIDVETEVEHPHEDWIAPAVELGSIAGLAWIGFLLAVGWGAWTSLRSGVASIEPFALGAIGTLAYALVHAPLTREPTSAAVAAVLFGAVLARREHSAPSLGRRVLPVAAALLLLILAPRALAFVRHGLAISDLAHPTNDRALEFCPDSPLALDIRAAVLTRARADQAATKEAWEHLLAVRPERFSAHAWLEDYYLNQDDPDFRRARIELEHRLRIDPNHPSLSGTLGWFDREEYRLDPTRTDLVESDLSPEVCYQRSRKERSGGDRMELAGILEARAHFLWAREHVGLGRFSDAVRSYRQCLRVTRDLKGNTVRVRLELAAALVKAGRQDDARVELRDLEASDDDRAAMPAWATDALRGLE